MSPSYFKLQVRWLRLLTRITDPCQLIGIRSVAACLPFELFRGKPDTQFFVASDSTKAYSSAISS
ncbi:hypothetical protein CKQ54_11205 [Rahnella variigena]|uniref:Uncharacterized protein n=1 Tax=Rahnella variigena TaxID=574964 RepID=A0ABX9PUZ8_9GAMM|nr:hypothetical protein D6D38_02085 [Rahnella variigena]RKF68896.1 hypothetical protein CKQ54_11205 [Rahnella variigena]